MKTLQKLFKPLFFIGLILVTLAASNFPGNWIGTFLGTATITSGMITNTAVYFNFNIQTANYTATTNDSTILLNASSLTLSLPSAVGLLGKEYTIKNGYSSTQTINATGSQTIDGSTSYTLSSLYNAVTIQSDNANWWIKSSH